MNLYESYLSLKRHKNCLRVLDSLQESGKTTQEGELYIQTIKKNLNNHRKSLVSMYRRNRELIDLAFTLKKFYPGDSLYTEVPMYIAEEIITKEEDLLLNDFVSLLVIYDNLVFNVSGLGDTL